MWNITFHRPVEPTMVCERCGRKTYVIFLTRDHGKICDFCEEKLRKKEKE